MAIVEYDDSSNDDVSMPNHAVWMPQDRRWRDRGPSRFQRNRRSKEANAKQSHDFRFIGAVAMLLSTGWLYLHYGVKANVAEMTGNSPGGRRDEFYQGDAAEIRKLREELHTANKHIEGLERAVNLKPIDPQLASDNEQAVLRELTPKTTTHQPPAVSFHQQADPISSSLDRIAAKAINDTIVLSFCSIKYLQPMANWLAALNKHGIKNWGIVCLDQPMRKWLQEHNTECAYFLKGWKHGVYDPEESNVVCDKPGEHEAMSLSKCKAGCVNDVDCAAITYVQANKSCARCPENYQRTTTTGYELHHKRTTTTLWFARWKLLVRLLDMGISVMLADLDAIFLRNPISYLSSLPHADLITQRGSFPSWLSAKWGSALCMGFAYWRATPATRRFTVMMNKVLLKTGDDQIGVNVALDKANIVWDEGMTTFSDSRNYSYGSTEKGLRVAMLPHSMFPRKCDDTPIEDFERDVLVAHCFAAQKSGEAKKEKAKAFKLWVVQEGWENLPVMPVFEDYLSSLLLKD